MTVDTIYASIRREAISRALAATAMAYFFRADKMMATADLRRQIMD